MPRSADESQDDSENDDDTASRSESLTDYKVKNGRKGETHATAVVRSTGSRMGDDVAVAESDATGFDQLGFRSDASESERTPGAGYHNIANLGDDINLLDYVREHNTTLTFPEKLMLTLTYVERECAKLGKPENAASIGWVLDGKAFVVRNNTKLYSTWLPLFFGQSKFSSFTRKLYRWGFRKINLAPQSAGGTNANTFFFGNENFQRDKKELLTNMKSVTAAKTRCELASDTARNGWLPVSQEAPIAMGPPQDTVTIGATFPATIPNVALPQMTAPLLPGVTSGADQAALIQQAMNLAALQSLLAAPQAALQGQQVNLQQSQANGMAPAVVPSQYMSAPPLQAVPAAPQAQQVPQIMDYSQMLSQLAFSAALAAASGTLQGQQQPQQLQGQPQQVIQGQPQNYALAQPQTMVQQQLQAVPQLQPQGTSQPIVQGQQQTQPVPWWVNVAAATGQASIANVLPPPAVQEWRPPAQPDHGGAAPQTVMPNVLDPAQIRGMLDMVLRYGQATQQQQQQQLQPQQQQQQLQPQQQQQQQLQPQQQQQSYQPPQQFLQQPQHMLQQHQQQVLMNSSQQQPQHPPQPPPPPQQQ